MPSRFFFAALLIATSVGVTARPSAQSAAQPNASTTTLDDQTELVLQNATPEVLLRIAGVINDSSMRLIEQRKSQTTLERLFLEATQKSEPANQTNKRE